MIKNIIFDFGNVLVEYNIKSFLINKGLSPDMVKRVLKATIMGPFWDEFDRGAITEEEAFEGFVSLDPQIGNEIHTAFDNITGMLTIREFAIPWVQELKAAGYNVYYLSNYSRKAVDECADSIEFIKYMDGGVLSHRELMVKPNPDIYKLLMSRYGLTPEECIFIDDTEKNVDVAIELGMNGIIFNSYEETIDKMRDLGVKC